MGEKDIKTKLLEDYNDVFADIVNGLLFKKDYIDADYLKDGPTESIYKAEMGEDKEQRRDVLKQYEKNNILLCTFGLENQAKFDRTMPIRVMNYDAAAYKYQMKTKGEIYPVITIVLNFSNHKWGKANRLKEILNMPEEIAPFVSDYKINVFDIAFLTEEEISLFKSDFKIVADFFRQRRVNSEYKPLPDTIRHVSETLKLLAAFAEDKRYEEIIPEILKERKGSVNMCNIVEQFENRGYQKGEQYGYQKGEQYGYQKGEQYGYQKGEQYGYQKGEQYGYQKGEHAGFQRGQNGLLYVYFQKGNTAKDAADIFDMDIKEAEAIYEQWKKSK